MTTDHIRKAVVLLSGGLDSATVLAIAKHEGFLCHCLTFAYGQRHRVELDHARAMATHCGVAGHLVLNLDLHLMGGSALTTDEDIPKGRSREEMEGGIPATYVPGRNAIFLSCAVARAETLGARDIFIGVNALDYSGYPDCRPAFIRAFEEVANLGTKAGAEGQRFTIHAPLMRLTKKEIITKGMALGVDYSLTHSCYDPDNLGRACGACDSCLLRRKGFAEAGYPDPTVYQN